MRSTLAEWGMARQMRTKILCMLWRIPTWVSSTPPGPTKTFRPPSVATSCDEIAASRVQAFQGGNDATLVRNFLAAPGSQVYEEMRSRAWVYRLFTLQKPVA